MARARNIKPGIFKNEVLGVADPLYTLLFEGLWCLADREGRIEDRPLRIKAEVFPYRDGVQVEAMLAWLADQGFIARYEAAGKKVIFITEFAKHQSPHGTEKDSELPNQEGLFTIHKRGKNGYATGEFELVASVLTVKDLSTNTLIPDSGFLIPDSGISGGECAGPVAAPVAAPKPQVPAPASAAGYPADFELAWKAYPSRPGNSKADAFKAWSARINAGIPSADLIAGVQRYAVYVVAARVEPRFVKLGATFFGPGEHYLSDWTPPARASPSEPGKHSGFESKNYREGIAEDGSFT